MRKLASYNNVDGLDPSEGMLERAQKENPYQKTFQQFFTIGTGLEHSKSVLRLLSLSKEL